MKAVTDFHHVHVIGRNFFDVEDVLLGTAVHYRIERSVEASGEGSVGETLVLDDGGRFPPRSAPEFGDFDRIIPARVMGNRSFFFARRDNGWHGVPRDSLPQGLHAQGLHRGDQSQRPLLGVRDAVKGKSITCY